MVAKEPSNKPWMGTHLYAYTFDGSGRLTKVTDNNGTSTNIVENYTYDSNGNRLTELNVSANDNAQYDVQDRLRVYKSVDSLGSHYWTFDYADDGSLQRRTDNTTGIDMKFAYDEFGNLTRVELWAGGTLTKTIDYVVDGRGRRVAKKVNGVLSRMWLYDGQLRIVAERQFNTSGVATVFNHLVYGSRTNTPEVMLRTATPTSTAVPYRIFSDHLGSPRRCRWNSLGGMQLFSLRNANVAGGKIH